MENRAQRQDWLRSCSEISPSRSPQVQCERELRARRNIFGLHLARRVTEAKKARQAAALGLIGIHWKRRVVESPRMSDVIGATAYTPVVPGVHNIEHERRVETDGRMEATRWLPSPVTHTRYVFTVGTRRVQLKGDPSHGDDVAAVNQTAKLHLDALDRRINITRSAARGRLFSQNVPGFERLAQFQINVPGFQIAELRESKFEMRQEPLRFHGITVCSKIFQHVLKIAPNEMWQHPAVMNIGSPVNEVVHKGLFPEPGDETAKQQLLGKAHAGVGRHLESAHFEEPQASAAAFGRIKLINAEFGAVRVSSSVYQQVAEEAIHQPGSNVAIHARRGIDGRHRLVTSAAT